jgi:hypothetical protein
MDGSQMQPQIPPLRVGMTASVDSRDFCRMTGFSESLAAGGTGAEARIIVRP